MNLVEKVEKMDSTIKAQSILFFSKFVPSDEGTEDSIGRVNCPTLSSVSRIVSDPHRAAGVFVWT